jgi:hypothetical protein
LRKRGVWGRGMAILRRRPLIHSIESARSVPQGLKATLLCGVCGTAEAVPLLQNKSFPRPVRPCPFKAGAFPQDVKPCAFKAS